MTGRARGMFDRYSCQRCGKQTYPDRRTARQAAKAFHPGDSGLRAYRCDRGGTGWHIGHRRYYVDQVDQTPTETPSQNPADERKEAS